VQKLSEKPASGTSHVTGDNTKYGRTDLISQHRSQWRRRRCCLQTRNRRPLASSVWEHLPQHKFGVPWSLSAHVGPSQIGGEGLAYCEIEPI